MTKKEIVKAISDQTGRAQTDISQIVALTFEGIIETLLKEGRLELRNFGVFRVKCRKPRLARNPRSGLKIHVPEKFVVTFKAGKELEVRVQELEALAAQRARACSSMSDQDEEEASEPDDSANLQVDESGK